MEKRERVRGLGTREFHFFKIHRLHGAVHALDHARHAAGDLPHGDGGLHSAGDGVDARAQAEEVELLVLLADGVLGVDLGDVWVVLLDGLVVSGEL